MFDTKDISIISEGEIKSLFKALDLVNEDLSHVISVLGIDSQRGFYGDQGTQLMAKVNMSNPKKVKVQVKNYWHPDYNWFTEFNLSNPKSLTFVQRTPTFFLHFADTRT